MAISQSMMYDLDIEAADISTAFLQGLSFSEIVARASELGHEVKKMRQVWFPPPFIWHLRARWGRSILLVKASQSDVWPCGRTVTVSARTVTLPLYTFMHDTQRS